MKCPLSYSYWNWYGQLSFNRKKVTMMLNWTWEINNIHFWNNKFKFVRFISSRIASIFRSETFIFSLFFFLSFFLFFFLGGGGGPLHPSPCAYDWDCAIIISLQNSMTPSKYFSSKVFNPPSPLKQYWNLRNRRSQIFYNTGVVKNFAKFRGKHRAGVSQS